MVISSGDDDDLETDDDTELRPFEWLTSSQSLQPLLESLDLPKGDDTYRRTALHVGCGSSMLGQVLVDELGFDYVLNIDKDHMTLERMKKKFHTDARLEYKVVDFLDHRGAQDEPLNPKSSLFSVVVDKSTLDCTLCSRDASTGLLCLVHDNLQVGGYYIVISFNEVDFLLPLLRDCPGTNWTVTCHCMDRQVEDLVGNSSRPAVFSYITNSKQLNIFLCHKTKAGPALEWDDVSQHIHCTNNAWFQTMNPLLDGDRRQALSQAFREDESKGLLECYEILFTNAEREHLDYDNFLEDWEAYCEGHPGTNKDAMPLSVALDFLLEMQ